MTDMMEWESGGFSELQLWINLAAFIPMPFLLLGIYWVLRPPPSQLCFIGAGLYGAAFIYFLYSTIYALVNRVPDYQTLWSELGIPYTVAGGLMILGGCLFAVEALRSSRLPKIAVWAFLVGLVVNLGLAILPAPDILQTVGSGIRNMGLLLMGNYIFHSEEGTEA